MPNSVPDLTAIRLPTSTPSKRNGSFDDIRHTDVSFALDGSDEKFWVLIQRWLFSCVGGRTGLKQRRQLIRYRQWPSQGNVSAVWREPREHGFWRSDSCVCGGWGEGGSCFFLIVFSLFFWVQNFAQMR
jgi:hypothetical protein